MSSGIDYIDLTIREAKLRNRYMGLSHVHAESLQANDHDYALDVRAEMLVISARYRDVKRAIDQIKQAKLN